MAVFDPPEFFNHNGANVEWYTALSLSLSPRYINTDVYRELNSHPISQLASVHQPLYFLHVDVEAETSDRSNQTKTICTARYQPE